MKTFYLITVNSNGSITYACSGSYRAMRKLARESYHIVTSIENYDKAVKKYGINR